MHFHFRGIALVVACLGAAVSGVGSGLAVPTLGPGEPVFPTLAKRVADSGIDIVRMPKGSAAASGTQTPSGTDATKSQGRLLKLPVKVGSLPSDSTKGWLGTRLDPIETPLATQLGVEGGNGALVLDTVAGGPANQSGLRFGDIVVALNGRPVLGASDLFRRVSSVVPGGNATLDVWRFGADEAEFLQALRRLGHGGNAPAMALLGKLYATGSGVVRDDTEAMEWYRKGAAAGHLAAMTAVGSMVLEGRGASRDPQEGINWLRAAADKNHAEAQYRLGRVLVEGKVTAKDAPEALRLFNKSAEAGYIPAMADLGIMYSRGEGVEADFAKAASWYKRAADLGNAAAMVNLGLLHQQGKGVTQDNAAAVSYYRKAMALGHPAGIHNLAWMLDSGKGVERKDPEEAASLMMKSLDRRHDFSHKQMTQNARAWSKEFRLALQRRLREGGFYSGPVDGEFKDSTVAAIDAYMNRSR
jgi:TPR repeat protein